MNPSLAGMAALVLALGTASVLDAQAPHISQLDWLVGQWTFEDVEIEGDYREAGTRDCHYALGGDYIVCESRGTDHRGNERTYLWYFNYNDQDERFEIVSLFEGFPRKLMYTLEVSEDGYTLQLTYHSVEGDELVVSDGPTVTYDGAGEWIWTNGRFRDVVTRR